jgi:hypothetical protein
MQGKHSQLYRNTREKNMLGSYSRFRALLEISATYETLYTDNGGRQIVVIQPLDMFCFFNKLFAELRDETPEHPGQGSPGYTKGQEPELHPWLEQGQAQREYKEHTKRRHT